MTFDTLICVYAPFCRSREVVSSLVEEYQAAEGPHYSTWGVDSSNVSDDEYDES